jgi:hypothetical protein
MTEAQSVPIPEVYILWHPQCQLGKPLARRIMTWLRPGNSGLGPEVFYRSLPAPEAKSDGLPPPLPLEMRPNMPPAPASKATSNLQLVLALIDENMVADFAWRHWLDQLAPRTQPQPQPNRIIWPVALDATAYNMPTSIKCLNYFRPAGLPVSNAAVEQRSHQFELVVRSLLKQITEAMCRVMLPKRTADGTAALEQAPKVSIFLSHAKADGTVPARRIRDYIYSQTQLAAFYDENDIAFGSGFALVIEQDLKSMATAAMISVRSAKYSSRPWCRRELSMFRRPRPEDQEQESVAKRWRLYPTLVVEAMGSSESTSGMAELGNSPIIRWADDDNNLAELIVTSVIRDAMLASFHSALGRTIALQADQIVINWLPDPTTLLHIPAVHSDRKQTVFHPGRELSGLEIDILEEFLPNLEFKSFEEALS